MENLAPAEESNASEEPETTTIDPAAPVEPNPVLAAVRAIVLVGGLSLAAAGMLAGGAGFILSLAVPEGQLALATLSFSFAALTVAFGLALAWQAWRSMQGQPSPGFEPRHVWLLAAAFFLVVAFGHAVVQADFLPALTFPPMHVLASVLPPLVIVALAARSLAGAARTRDVVFQLGSGTLVATLFAFTLEMVIVLGVLAVVLGIVLAQPGGPERIQALVNSLQNPAWLQDPSNLYKLARSSYVRLPALFIFAVAVPLVEELVKTVGVPLRSYRRPDMAQAMLWGLAGGAGFALAEGLFNSLGGIDSWAVVVSFRVGATLLHSFTGAMMGLAWYFALAQRRWGRWLSLYAACVGIHGLWNLLVAGTAFSSLNPPGAEPAGLGLFSAGPGIPTAVVLLALIALGVTVGLMGLTAWVGDQRASAISTAGYASGEAVEAPDDGGD